MFGFDDYKSRTSIKHTAVHLRKQNLVSSFVFCFLTFHFDFLLLSETFCPFCLNQKMYELLTIADWMMTFGPYFDIRRFWISSSIIPQNLPFPISLCVSFLYSCFPKCRFAFCSLVSRFFLFFSNVQLVFQYLFSFF